MICINMKSRRGLLYTHIHFQLLLGKGGGIVAKLHYAWSHLAPATFLLFVFSDYFHGKSSSKACQLRYDVPFTYFQIHFAACQDPNRVYIGFQKRTSCWKIYYIHCGVFHSIKLHTNTQLRNLEQVDGLIPFGSE